MNQYGSTFSVFVPDTSIGVGAVENVGLKVKELGAKKVLIVTDPWLVKAGLADKVKAPLEKEGIEFGVFDSCEINAPISIIERCAQVIKEGGYELLIGLGGGSVIDTVKAASIVVTAEKDIRSYIGRGKVERAGLPKILMPTTAGTGSEWSRALVMKEDATGEKNGIYSNYLYAQAVIIDPLMTLNLPAKTTAETGMDALCHGIEAYTCWKANLVSDIFAEKGIKLIADNLRVAYGKGSKNIEARYNMSVAAALVMASLMSSGAHLIHGMAYPVQDFSQPPITHAVSVAIMLPHVMEYNMPVNLLKLANIAELMGEQVEGLSLLNKAQRAIEAVKRLSIDVGIPQRMRDVGIKREDIPRCVDNVFDFHSALIPANPRDCSRDDMAKIFEAAW